MRDTPPHQEDSASRVVDRLREVLGCASDADLARALGVQPSTPGNWRSRGSVPYAQAAAIATQRGISLDWLLLGQDRPALQDHRAEYRSGAPPPGAPGPLDTVLDAMASAGLALTASQISQAADLVATHDLTAAALADVLRLLHRPAGDCAPPQTAAD